MHEVVSHPQGMKNQTMDSSWVPNNFHYLLKDSLCHCFWGTASAGGPATLSLCTTIYFQQVQQKILTWLAKFYASGKKGRELVEWSFHRVWADTMKEISVPNFLTKTSKYGETHCCCACYLDPILFRRRLIFAWWSNCVVIVLSLTMVRFGILVQYFLRLMK